MNNDLISRAALLDVLQHAELPDYFDGAETVCWMMDKVENAPAADAEPVRRGEWEHTGKRFEGGIDWFQCSECKCIESGVYVYHPFCSMCGAKMNIAKDRE